MVGFMNTLSTDPKIADLSGEKGDENGNNGCQPGNPYEYFIIALAIIFDQGASQF